MVWILQRELCEWVRGQPFDLDSAGDQAHLNFLFIFVFHIYCKKEHSCVLCTCFLASFFALYYWRPYIPYFWLRPTHLLFPCPEQFSGQKSRWGGKWMGLSLEIRVVNFQERQTLDNIGVQKRFFFQATEVIAVILKCLHLGQAFSF